MNKNEVMKEWAEKPDRVFMYRRYEWETPAPCVVVGFQSKQERTDRWSKERTVTYVKVQKYWRQGHDLGECLVLPRHLTHATNHNLDEYWQEEERIQQAKDDREQHHEQVRTELADLLKELMPSENVWLFKGQSGIEMGYNIAERLIGVLKDARLFYNSLASDSEGVA